MPTISITLKLVIVLHGQQHLQQVLANNNTLSESSRVKFDA
jgi:hypothetical protein